MPFNLWDTSLVPGFYYPPGGRTETGVMPAIPISQSSATFNGRYLAMNGYMSDDSAGIHGERLLLMDLLYPWSFFMVSLHLPYLPYAFVHPPSFPQHGSSCTSFVFVDANYVAIIIADDEDFPCIHVTNLDEIDQDGDLEDVPITLELPFTVSLDDQAQVAGELMGSHTHSSCGLLRFAPVWMPSSSRRRLLWA